MNKGYECVYLPPVFVGAHRTSHIFDLLCCPAQSELSQIILGQETLSVNKRLLQLITNNPYHLCNVSTLS